MLYYRIFDDVDKKFFNNELYDAIANNLFNIDFINKIASSIRVNSKGFYSRLRTDGTLTSIDQLEDMRQKINYILNCKTNEQFKADMMNTITHYIEQELCKKTKDREKINYLIDEWDIGFEKDDLMYKELSKFENFSELRMKVGIVYFHNSEKTKPYSLLFRVSFIGDYKNNLGERLIINICDDTSDFNSEIHMGLSDINYENKTIGGE